VSIGKLSIARASIGLHRSAVCATWAGMKGKGKGGTGTDFGGRPPYLSQRSLKKLIADPASENEAREQRLKAMQDRVEKKRGRAVKLYRKLLADKDAESARIHEEADAALRARENIDENINLYGPNFLGPKFDESKAPGYAGAPPPSEAAVTPPLRMRDDFDIAAQRAKAERTAAGRLANYEFLAGTVDLENPALALAEQRRRAYLLLTAYDRVQEVKQGFKDSNTQLTAARRIKQAAHRERERAKRPPAPRGRPRKAAQP
jgi:hypothetical protein